MQLLAQLPDDLAEAVRVLLDDAPSFLEPGGLGFLNRFWFLGLSHGPMVRRDADRPLS
jgi:hypothetical protein